MSQINGRLDDQIPMISRVFVSVRRAGMRIIIVFSDLTLAPVTLRGTHCQVESLAAASKQLNYHAGALRSAQRGQISHMKQMDKSSVDFDHLHEQRP